MNKLIEIEDMLSNSLNNYLSLYKIDSFSFAQVITERRMFKHVFKLYFYIYDNELEWHQVDEALHLLNIDLTDSEACKFTHTHDPRAAVLYVEKAYELLAQLKLLDC